MTGLQAWQQWAPVPLSRQRIMQSLRLPLLASSLLVTGCTTMMPFGSGQSPAGPQAEQPTPIAPVAAAPQKVAILLPLSGPNGGLGESMLRAAKLALAAPGSPALDAHDTAGPAGAAEAARSAVQAGDGIILGPLTAGDTEAVAPVAHAAGLPVLAFTSTVSLAQPGVWVLGVTPEQQVRRMVFAAKAEGRSRIAALLPSSALGSALADGLTRACVDAGLPPPTILTHAGTPDSIDATMKQLADLSGRQAQLAQQSPPPAMAAPASPAPASPAAAPPGAPGTAPGNVSAAPPAPPLPPPPFDALLLGDTGLQLQEVIASLKASGVSTDQVRVMGPGLWGAFASKLRALSGAWYAAPDPAARLGFVEQYQAVYHQSPKPLADIPYDAAALARSLAPTGYQQDQLLRQDGFAGVDGVFTLKPDGHVHRALAIFQIQPGGGAHIVQSAPRSLSDTGS